jgi:collagen type II alpha
MKVSRSFIAITVAFSLAMLPSAIAVDKTSARSAGPTPTTVVNTILSGAGIPSKTLGINGDFYIDTKNLNLYGPKSKGGWKVSTSLRANEVPVIANVIGEPGAMGQTGAKGATGATGATGALGETGLQGLQGPQGLQGVQGVQGTKGDNGINGSTGATGTQGVQGTKGDNGTNGAQGIQGLQGLTGAAGTNGLTGAQGLPGLQGSTGVTGNVGATGATGGQGVKGDTGLTGATGGQGSQGATGGQGAKGDTGLTGATGGQGSQGAKGDTGLNGSTGGQGSQGATGGQGAKGDTGLTGSTGSQGEAGISVSKFLTIPAATLTITSAGSSTKQTFFTVDTTGSYTFQIIVSGLANFMDAFKLNAEIVIGNEAIINQFTTSTDAESYANGVSGRQYGFFVIGSVSNVSAGTIISLRITNQEACGGGTPILFMGRALVNKVGSIG